MEKANVVIVGAGIGGVRAAQELAGKRNVHVTLLDRNNYQLFPPLLYQVSTATLATGESLIRCGSSSAPAGTWISVSARSRALM